MRSGEVLKLYRILNGYSTIKELAEDCDIDKHTLSIIERCNRDPSRKVLQALADIYGISYQAFVISVTHLCLYTDLDVENRDDLIKAETFILSTIQSYKKSAKKGHVPNCKLEQP